MSYIQNVILLSHKNNEILLFSTTWLDLESIMHSEIRQKEKDTLFYHLYMESKNKNECIQQNSNGLTDIENKFGVTSGERELGRGEIGVWD